MKYIKTIDESLAKQLSDAGFFYTSETFFDGNILYVFEVTEELINVLDKIKNENEYSSLIYFEDKTLNY